MIQKLIHHSYCYTLSGKPLWYSHKIKKIIIPNIIDMYHIYKPIPYHSNFDPYVLYILYKKYNQQIISNININTNNNHCVHMDMETETPTCHDKLIMHYSSTPYIPIIIANSYSNEKDILRDIRSIQSVQHILSSTSKHQNRHHNNHEHSM